MKLFGRCIFHDWVYLNRPIGVYDLSVWWCSDCKMYKLNKSDKKELWFSEQQYIDAVDKLFKNKK